MNPAQQYSQLDSEANRLHQRWLAQWSFLWSDRALECDQEYLEERQQTEREAFSAYSDNISKRIRLVWEDMVSSLIAKLADERPQPSSEGYVAERHPSMPNLILVWAPCGCIWVGPEPPEAPFMTPCNKDSCAFSWDAVKAALEAFRASEALLKEGKSGNGISVAVDRSSPVDGGVQAGEGTAELGATSDEAPPLALEEPKQ